MMKRGFLLIIGILLTVSVAADNTEARLKAMQQEARTIISKMTVKEKISQLMNEAEGIPRLGIKPYNWWNEALHGVARDGKATVFPQPIGMAATFDNELIKKIGEAISTEARAKYNVAQNIENYAIYAGLTFWSPNVNIFRDPRWGRGMETWGEDPFLTGTLGTAFVEGMQGDDPVYLRVAACAKHYAVHSGPEGTRHKANIHPSKHDLYETYLPAFKMLVQKGKVEAIMGAYNRLYDESCSGSKFLLTDVLRKDWGFKGHVVSDCGAVYDIYRGHQIAKSAAEAAAISIKAGLNLECGNTFYHIQEALDKGMLTEKDIDNALFPLMMTRLKLGILHPDAACPYKDFDESVICSDKHREIAREAARRCMVLLKNNDVLPLKKDIRKMFIAGPGATDTYFLMGNYFGLSNYYSSYLQGIITKVSNGTSVNYTTSFNSSYPSRRSANWTAGEAAKADVTVAFFGLSGNLEGEEGEAIESDEEGDRKNLSIPESQMIYFRELIKTRKRNPDNKIIAVITGGSPLDVREIAADADAVIVTWYPGQEGGNALGDLLFGDASFSGRLPITYPEDVAKLPPIENYDMKGRTYKYMKDNIQYPFGYGLTYGKIIYSDVSAKKEKKDKIVVSATVSNESSNECDEIAQVYLSAPTAGSTSPISSLVAFKRIHLNANSQTKIEFTIDEEQLKTIMDDGTSKLLKGSYTFHIGGAAPSSKTKELGISMTTVEIRL